MSDKEVKNEKVMTKYDRKMERRKEQKKQDQKEEKITTAVIVLMLVAFVAFIVSFPIRSIMAQYETVVTINGEDISRVEFDYNYSNVVNDYVSQYGSYLGLFGLDTSQDFSTQMYDENLSWKDYFEEMTVENMKSTKAIKAEADAAGFEFDTTQEVADFKAAMKEAAATAQVSTTEYVKQLYGQYASLNNLSDFVAEGARINAYYEQVSKGMVASDEEIDAYYEENTNNYDSVDYYVSEFPAELTAEAPTEEEIAAAMNEACDLADAAVDHLELQGDEMTNMTYADAPYAIADWLFEDGRKEGDTNVIEDASNNMYYAVEFIQRYRDETATANVRTITLEEDNGQAILDEWKAGNATQESFAELCKKYTVDSAAISNGGLMEGVTEENVNAELAEWIFAEERGVGDTTTIAIEDGYTYVLYYVGQGEPEWKVDIAGVLLSERQSEYMTSIAENVTVEDKKGKLNYLKVQAEAEAAVSDGDVSGADVAVSEGDVSAN